MSSTREWLVKHDEFFFWADSVFALRDTKNVLRKFTKDKVEDFLDSNFTSEEKNHLKREFVPHNRQYRNLPEMVKKQRCSDPVCTRIWKKIVENHIQDEPALFFDDVKGDTGCDLWWIFLKRYLPKGYTTIKSFHDCDAIAFCKIFERCRLFENVNNDKLSKLVYTRNKLMHSSTNEVTANEKREYINDMIKFLADETFNDRAEIQDVIQQLGKDKGKIRDDSCNHLKQFKELNDALELQKKSIEKDLKYFSTLNLTMPDLEMLANKTKENLDTVRKSIDLQATVLQVTVQGGLAGSHEMGFLGYYAGAAGAFVVGNMRKT